MPSQFFLSPCRFLSITLSVSVTARSPPSPRQETWPSPPTRTTAASSHLWVPFKWSFRSHNFSNGFHALPYIACWFVRQFFIHPMRADGYQCQCTVVSANSPKLFVLLLNLILRRWP